MKAAIMQPYLFPYLGYFQLIRSVNEFIVYDDVNYIKGGWINRNYILCNAEKQLVTIPLNSASPNKLINEIDLKKNHKILKTISYNYKNAPYFSTIYPIIEEILTNTEENLSKFLLHQLKVICNYLELRPTWKISSSIEKNNDLHGEEKVLSICKEIGATHYINSSGGKELYDKVTFIKQNIQLSFIRSRIIEYQQFKKPFIPNLSIIDIMMFNHQHKCIELLEEYELF